MNGAKLRYSQHDGEDRRSLTVAHLRVGIFPRWEQEKPQGPYLTCNCVRCFYAY